MAPNRVRRLALALLAALPAMAQNPTAADLLLKAQSAFEQNQERELHWNWNTSEDYTVLNSAHNLIQRLPSVTAESVIRIDGRRCNAVLEWGDGVPPYKLNESADVRCSGQDPVKPPLRVDSLLKFAHATLTATSADSYTLTIRHDKARLHDSEPEVRCTASVEATVKLDRATFFPIHLEGRLVDTGCEGESSSELHYGEEQLSRPSKRALFKGTTFRMEFAFQPDRYGHPENGYWICTEQYWSSPIAQAGGVVYFNRRVALTPVVKSGFLVKEIHTQAQEFGVRSLTRYDIVPK
jgi:hypothetical protein